MRSLAIGLMISITTIVWANPHWDPTKAPLERLFPKILTNSKILNELRTPQGLEVMRLYISWKEDETYRLEEQVIEASGTQALLARSTRQPQWGSYRGELIDPQTKQAVYFDSIGTGKQYRKLARGISLRFPIPTKPMEFILYAENPNTGKMEKVLEQTINPKDLLLKNVNYQTEVRELSKAEKNPALVVTLYAEGYREDEKERFWRQAAKTINILQKNNFPGVEHMQFNGVFSTSNKRLGTAKNLGYPIPEYDSFLGLYFPYWNEFGRWYHVVYPTSEKKFRERLASAPYDYPIILVNDGGYWGVGNFKTHTAIPANNESYASYLLLHEFGHFFGLNEEYEGGGRTELEFAPKMIEPWSQNLTFLDSSSYQDLKWNEFVSTNMSIPTPASQWYDTPPQYGAYRGGYGDSPTPKGVRYKPGLGCIMESQANFCKICKKGIMDVIQFDLGT